MTSKGKVVLVNVELSTDNGLSPAGAKITMTFGKNVYRAEADADGKAEIPEVAKVLVDADPVGGVGEVSLDHPRAGHAGT